MSDKDTNLIWMDLEMTGLNLDIHKVIQIALVITNKDLDIIYQGIEISIHQPLPVINRANSWVKQNCQELLAKSHNSQISRSEAETQLLTIIQKYCDKKTSPLCGNSIWNDRRFLAKYFPKLEGYFHHRIIDVSTIKELYLRWYPNANTFPKSEKHQALQDIQESIEELKFYRQNFLKLGDP